ncbi:AraC-like DNA-binding protein [Chitinophaga japonensis]|uniref:AraC-like DNA-binding protein n=2 Tax=Chitinophaga japonensis TaxID=104662 RepID=A0A562T2W7_CHIJA|nr:AraC-like DNA-binding protein [Chitinophaga japonensis]
MTAPLLLPSVHFEVSKVMKARIRIYDQLPDHYKSYYVDGATIYYVDGPFGCYFTQEIRNEDWSVLWFQSFIKSSSFAIYPCASLPAVVFYCGIQGSLSGYLNGVGRLLLKEAQYSIFYMPKSVVSVKLFRGAYDGVFLSLSKPFLEGFASKYESLKDVYNSYLEEAIEGQLLKAHQLGSTAWTLLSEMRARVHKAPADRFFFLDNHIRELLFGYLTSSPTTLRNVSDPVMTVSAVYTEQVRKAAKYMEENYDRELTIPEIAKIINMGYSSFIQAFKKEYDLAPHQFLKKCRLQKALLLLEETNEKIISVSIAVGYNNPSHFIKVFTKYFGISPFSYRNKRKRNLEKG